MGKETNFEDINNQFKNIKNEFEKIGKEYSRIVLLERADWSNSDYYFMTKYYLEGTSHEADKPYVELTYSSNSNDEGVKYTETLGKDPDYKLAQDTAKEALKDLIFLDDEQKKPFKELELRATAVIKEKADAKSIQDDAIKYGKNVQKMLEGYREYSNHLFNKIEELAPNGVVYHQATKNEPRSVTIISNDKNSDLEALCTKYNNNQILIHTLSAEHKGSITPNLDRLKAYSQKHYGPEGEAIKKDRNWGGWKYFDLAATLLTIVTLPFRLYKDGFSFYKSEGAKKHDKAEGSLKEAGIEPPPQFKK